MGNRERKKEGRENQTPSVRRRWQVFVKMYAKKQKTKTHSGQRGRNREGSSVIIINESCLKM